MPAIHDDAVCIRHWDWSETSQTVSIFTRTLGVVRALAKGAKRPKAPYSGGIELLTFAQAGLIVRPSSDLALLTSWDLRRTFPALRSGLGAYHAGMYMADLVNHFVRDHDPHPVLFDALLGALDRLAAPDDVPLAILAFQWSTLVEAGYKPALNPPPAPANGSTSTPRRFHLFHPSLGGLAPLEDPEHEQAAAGESTAWRVRAETIDVLNRLSSDGPAFPGHVRPPAAVVDRANRLLAAYLRHVLGAEPPTQPVLFGPRLPR